jgi:hypothetical protein
VHFNIIQYNILKHNTANKVTWCKVRRETVELPMGCGASTKIHLITEKQLLIVFFKSTGGSSWKKQWDLHRSTFAWHGVTIDSKLGMLTVLDLPRNNLSGLLEAIFRRF